MDANTPPADELNELASRLAAWQPSTSGLDRDRMLFAAGRQSVRPGRGRVVWPVISGCLAILAAMLGVELVRERTGKMADTSGGIEAGGMTASISHPPLGLDIHHYHALFVPIAADMPSSEPPAPDSYLATSRLLAQGLDEWPVLARVDSPTTPVLPRPILKANSSGDTLEP